MLPVPRSSAIGAQRVDYDGVIILAGESTPERLAVNSNTVGNSFLIYFRRPYYSRLSVVRSCRLSVTVGQTSLPLLRDFLVGVRGALAGLRLRSLGSISSRALAVVIVVMIMVVWLATLWTASMPATYWTSRTVVRLAVGIRFRGI